MNLRIESNVESTKVNSPFALLTNQVSLGVGQFGCRSVWVVSLVEHKINTLQEGERFPSNTAKVLSCKNIIIA